MIEKIDFKTIAALNQQPYFNTLVNDINDHVVRMGIMTEQYPWHRHPNSDEMFIGVEGTVIIETHDQTFELTPGSAVTIPRDVPHRTRPKEGRSVNLTVELRDMETVFL